MIIAVGAGTDNNYRCRTPGLITHSAFARPADHNCQLCENAGIVRKAFVFDESGKPVCQACSEPAIKGEK